MSGTTGNLRQVTPFVSQAKFVGELNVKALDRTFIHLLEWIDQQDDMVEVDEVEVRAIAKRYMETGELKFSYDHSRTETGIRQNLE